MYKRRIEQTLGEYIEALEAENERLKNQRDEAYTLVRYAYRFLYGSEDALSMKYSMEKMLATGRGHQYLHPADETSKEVAA